MASDSYTPYSNSHEQSTAHTPAEYQTAPVLSNVSHPSRQYQPLMTQETTEVLRNLSSTTSKPSFTATNAPTSRYPSIAPEAQSVYQLTQGHRKNPHGPH